MATELKRFTEAYATMTVAAYEPLILRWISMIGVRFISNAVAYRLPKAAAVKYNGKIPAALALSRTVRKKIPPNVKFRFDEKEAKVPIDIHGRAINPAEVKKVDVPGYPNAVAIGKNVYLDGVTATDPKSLSEKTDASEVATKSTKAPAKSVVAARFATLVQGVTAIPMVISSRLGKQQAGFDFELVRDTVEKNLIDAAREWVLKPNERDLGQMMLAATNAGGVLVPHMWPGARSIHEALSPIGIAHYYRQLYFNKEEGVGPIEEAFTVAPLETLEVIHQTVRKQIHEEILEQGLEVVSEAAVEEKNLDEVSDKVSSMVQQDVSASMSANASGGIGVWKVGASASANFKVSSQRSREYSTRRLKEVTTRASERITKSFSIKTKDTTEVTESTTTRRVIRNDGAVPVSYGLRRVLRRVKVKVQELGPKLVWQLYLSDPGAGLAGSRFVHIRESKPISHADIPPGVPPRPSGGSESESTTCLAAWNAEANAYCVTIVVKPGSDRVVTGLRIDNITDLESGGKDDHAPAPLNDCVVESTWVLDTQSYTAVIGVHPGDGLSMQVSYTYTWEPSEKVLTAWQNQCDQANAKLDEDALIKQFEQNKNLITERSKIKSRPANDLRREERSEVMNRMVSYLFGRGDDPSEPSPLEIEYFDRYFDIDAIFTYTHPSWWKPRFASSKAGIEREAYEITAESEPAPLGSSLGWRIQLDGDRRRNEFINSPWVRICIPMQPGREREAIQWLAKHLEGDVGYDITSGPLVTLIDEIEQYRDRENRLGLAGADYVTVTSTPGAPADPATPEGVYPVVDEFDVTVPTDGFVFDELKVNIP